ncbi:MAG: LamG domain-containing protein, partial [Phaeodactylibacter sp.]|nr:LamG domain-containing protein [Phaeodactylibacter sp.]
MRSIYLFPLLFLCLTLNSQTPGGQMYFADVDVFNNPGPGQGVVRYLSCGDIDITAAITMEAWVRFAIPTDNQKIMGKVDANGGAFFDDGYLLGVNNSRINPEIWTPTNQQFTEGFIPPVSIWHHIAVTYAVGGDYKAYLDGNLVYEQAAGGTNIVNDNTDFIIGIAPWDLSSFMSFGSMDEIRLWEVARTEEEIRYGMFRNLSGVENGLVLYMNFDNDDGSPTIPDLSAANHDCSKNNMDATNFIESDCVIGNAATQMMHELAGIWFASNAFLQDPRVVETNNGLSLSAQFNGQDTSAYVVWGH